MAPPAIDNSTEERVRRFVASFHDCSIERIALATTLFGDLGIDGDEGDDFFVQFSEKFKVDLSGLDLNRHFGPEGVYWWWPFYFVVHLVLYLLFLWVVDLYRSRTREEKAGLIPITVSDLVSAAKSGRWVPNEKAIQKRGI